MTSKTRKIPFDIDKVKAGANVVTRDGRKAVYLRSTPSGMCYASDYPCVFAVLHNSSNVSHGVSVWAYTVQGSYDNEHDTDHDLFIIEKYEPKRVPFDLEKAKAGATLITRGGNPARFMGVKDHPSYPIVAVYENGSGIELVESFTAGGAFNENDADPRDLFILE